MGTGRAVGPFSVVGLVGRAGTVLVVGSERGVNTILGAVLARRASAVFNACLVQRAGTVLVVGSERGINTVLGVVLVRRAGTVVVTSSTRKVGTMLHVDFAGGLPFRLL